MAVCNKTVSKLVHNCASISLYVDKFNRYIRLQTSAKIYSKEPKSVTTFN